MTFRLKVLRAHLEVISGEIPMDLLRACRELAAEHPGDKGTIVLWEETGGFASAAFHGKFSPDFQQRLRNLWALEVRGEKIPQRLNVHGRAVPIFQIAVRGGEAHPVLGNPPDAIMKFCQAFARANAAAVVRVSALLEDSAVRLHVTGEMPEPVQERLRRRWAKHLEDSSPPRPPPVEAPAASNGAWPGSRLILGAICTAVTLGGLVLTDGQRGRVHPVVPGSEPRSEAVPLPAGPAAPHAGEPALANGEVVEQRGPTGRHTFYVDNREPAGFIARLVQRDGLARKAFFVGALQRAQVQGIQDGVYDLVFVSGRGFSRMTGQFESSVSVSRLDQPFEFRTEQTPGGIRSWTKGVVTRAPEGTIRRFPASSEWARK